MFKFGMRGKVVVGRNTEATRTYIVVIRRNLEMSFYTGILLCDMFSRLS